MNQIPNIEETHNTREVEEIVDKKLKQISNYIFSRSISLQDSAKYERQVWIDTLHQQLQKALEVQAIQIREEEANEYNKIIECEIQKAREEERERIFGEIEQFKSEVVTMDYCDDFKDGIYATIEHILSIPFFISVLDHSELDQDPVHDFFTAPEEVKRPVYKRALAKTQEEQEKKLDQEVKVQAP